MSTLSTHCPRRTTSLLGPCRAWESGTVHSTTTSWTVRSGELSSDFSVRTSGLDFTRQEPAAGPPSEILCGSLRTRRHRGSARVIWTRNLWTLSWVAWGSCVALSTAHSIEWGTTVPHKQSAGGSAFGLPEGPPAWTHSNFVGSSDSGDAYRICNRRYKSQQAVWRRRRAASLLESACSVGHVHTSERTTSNTGGSCLA